MQATSPMGRDLARVIEERRCEWDERASAQMRLIESICLSDTSPQYGSTEENANCSAP
ncbi:hypothetical protein ACFUNF_41570 [Streptomyces sp. NPDC057291]|uniref:hypothetical protein n=1 Tax=Streptomyces sp. NPDC057291 TaxID=3346087 RepID=UPI0036410F96